MMKSSLTNSLREFNTSGICKPQLHYYVSRIEEVDKALVGIDKGRYYTLFASRQMGKTTFVQELVGKLDKEKYCPVVISFETMIDVEENVFYERFSEKLRDFSGLEALKNLEDFKDGHDFERCVRKLQGILKKKFVLIIDEFDGLNKSYIGKLLHTFRDIYFHRGDTYNLHSLILIGVRNITDVNMDHASPFNTNDEIQLPAFTKEQVFDLIQQYEEETGQNFTQEVKEQIFYNTQGQPGLTNALCKMLTEDFNPGNKEEIGRRAFNRMFSFFMHEHISKNTVNVLNKAKEYREKIIELFNTREKIEFNVDEEWIGYLYINGAIASEVMEDERGDFHKYVKFANPIYQKKLYNYFKPNMSPERSRYFEPGEALDKYYFSAEELDFFEIVKNYQRYVNRRGSQAFAHCQPRKDGTKVEAAYHYSLDAYLTSALDSLGGSSVTEFPTGNGKVDIFVYFKEERYLIEIKNYTDEGQVKRAGLQLCRYAKSEGLSEAYLIIFTEVHPRDRLDVHTEEEIEGIRIRSVLVNVNF